MTVSQLRADLDRAMLNYGRFCAYETRATQRRECYVETVQPAIDTLAAAKGF